ncbi:phosphatase PAP2 family protein [Kitasatospora sp. NPDC050543]|uniref:phosphatase PAP2 family protein n=1 Tax=Kitasatospora sp. NPDC050543 TaxID=3364054 RepID=UPI003795812F
MTDLRAAPARPGPGDAPTGSHASGLARARNAPTGAGRLRLLAWPGYLLALGWYLLTYGLPYSNDMVFVWLIGALIAGAAHGGGGWRGWLLVLRDWVPVMAVIWTYSLLRGYGAHTPWPVRYQPQLDIDTFLGGGETWTVRLQHWLYTPGLPHWYDYAAVAVYMSHFFVVFIVLAVLWRRHHTRFRQLLALYLTLTFVGFATYILYPADPPWLTAQEGHMPVHTRVVWDVLNGSGLPRAASVFENGSEFANDVAAMPSLHAAYPMMLALYFWPRASRPVRVLLAAYPAAMAFTLVYGGEHFIVDIVVGWAYAALICWGVPRLFGRRAARTAPTSAAEPAPTPTDPRR